MYKEKGMLFLTFWRYQIKQNQTQHVFECPYYVIQYDKICAIFSSFLLTGIQLCEVTDIRISIYMWLRWKWYICTYNNWF